MWTKFFYLFFIAGIVKSQDANTEATEGEPSVPPAPAPLPPDESTGRDNFPSFRSFSQKSLPDSFTLNLPSPNFEPEKFSINEESRNFPKEAIDATVADQAQFALIEATLLSRRRRQSDPIATKLEAPQIEDFLEDLTKKDKRDSSLDVPSPSFPTFNDISSLDISQPIFPDTESKLTPLEIYFADPSLKNYPPPAVPSAAVQPLPGGIDKKKKRAAMDVDDPSAQSQLSPLAEQPFAQEFMNQQNRALPSFANTMANVVTGQTDFPNLGSRQSFQSPSEGFRKKRNVRRIAKRQLGQGFPNFSQQSQTMQNPGLPGFPNTLANIGTGEFNSPNLFQSPFQNFRKKRNARRLAKRQLGQGFPNFSQQSQTMQNPGLPGFPNTLANIGTGEFNSPNLFQSPFQNFRKKRNARRLAKRQLGQGFPNFSQQSQTMQNPGLPGFPNTLASIGTSSFNVPDSQSRTIPQTIQRLRQKREATRQIAKRQIDKLFLNIREQAEDPTTSDALASREFDFTDPERRQFFQSVQRQKRIAQQDFPNFFKLSTTDALIATPRFPDTLSQIGNHNNLPKFTLRRKRGHHKNDLYEVTFVDNLDSFSSPEDNQFFRPSRQTAVQGGPRYPPLDPFGNTQYIPLPPSNPHFALPVTSEDPHMTPFKERFRRPLRNVDFDAFFDDLVESSDDVENFIYESSAEFSDSNVLSQLRRLHFY